MVRLANVKSTEAGTLMVPCGLKSMMIFLTTSVVLVEPKPVALALIVVVPVDFPVAVAVPEKAPPPIWTVELTVPMVGFTVDRLTVKPVAGAASVSATVNCALPVGSTSTLGGRMMEWVRTLIGSDTGLWPGADAVMSVSPCALPVTVNC